MAGLQAARASRTWWRFGAASAGLVGAGVSCTQARGLLDEWRTKHADRCHPCGGPTDGVEHFRPRPITSSSLRPYGPASHHAVVEAGARKPRTLVLFLGDSLVSGVGGQAGVSPLPAALPRAVAERLSHLGGGGAVQWASVGIIGAGVDRLADEGLPQLRDKLAGSEKGTTHVVVVLVVGVNDLKQMNFVGYREGLRRLVAELRTVAGELRDVARRGQVVDVFLPELSIADAPLLQRFPINVLARPICALWEREKRQAIDQIANAETLAFPPPPQGVDVASLFSPDEMHPSLRGYEWWADGLANQIHSRLSARTRHSVHAAAVE